MLRLPKSVVIPVAAVACGALATLCGAQTSGAPKSGASARTAAATKPFTLKRLPWGDPDISGNFTSKDEANTPFERPAEWAGRRLQDITPEEMAKANEQRRRQALADAPYPGGGSRTRGVAIAVPIHWFDSLDTTNLRPWLVTDPPDGKVPPVVDAAKQRQADAAAARRGRGTHDSYTDRILSDRCIVFGISAARTAGIYGNSTQIVQTKDYVAIRYEMVHETRIIPIAGRGADRKHNTPAMSTAMGDAVAHWEGDTLVVDTVNYARRPAVRGAITSAKLHTTERFRRVAPDKVEVTSTFDDPDTWTRPWTFAIYWTEDDTQPIFEYACHEGNYGLRNILSAGRSDDRRGIKSSDSVDAQDDLKDDLGQ
jgi:hypothetical protein